MKPYITLVAVDFSTSSDAAVERALDIASERPHAEVHLLSVQELTLKLMVPPHEELRSPVQPLRDLQWLWWSRRANS